MSRPKVRVAEHISYAFGCFLSVSSSSVPELRIQVLMLQFLQRDASGYFLCIPIMQSSIFSPVNSFANLANFPFNLQLLAVLFIKNTSSSLSLIQIMCGWMWSKSFWVGWFIINPNFDVCSFVYGMWCLCCSTIEAYNCYCFFLNECIRSMIPLSLYGGEKEFLFALVLPYLLDDVSYPLLIFNTWQHLSHNAMIWCASRWQLKLFDKYLCKRKIS